MVSGTSGTFTVVMLNTGSATWDESYRLGVVGDGSGDGSRFKENTGIADVGRVHLPQGLTVAPGQPFAFTFPVVAPATPATYDVKFRMVHELVQWFGDVAERCVIIAAPRMVQGDAASLVSMQIPATMDPAELGHLHRCCDAGSTMVEQRLQAQHHE